MPDSGTVGNYAGDEIAELGRSMVGSQPVGTSRRRRRALLGAALANPVGFFFLFRWLTWGMAVVSIYSRSTPEVNLRFEPGLLMYAALQLGLGALYTLVLHPRLIRSEKGFARLKPPSDLLMAGVADMVGSLVIVYSHILQLKEPAKGGRQRYPAA